MTEQIPLNPGWEKRFGGERVRFVIVDQDDTGNFGLSWIEHVVGAWIIAYRLFVDPERRNVRVGEIRIFPAEQREWGAGSWSGDVNRVPKKGIPSRVLRRVRISKPLREISAILADNPKVAERLGQLMEDTDPVEHLGLRRKLQRMRAAPTPAGVRPRGRPRLDDERLATVARDYVKGMTVTPRSPLRFVAERQQADVNRVRNWVREARRRGFLYLAGWTKDDGTSGVFGGELTDLAKQVLQRTRQQQRRQQKGKKGS